MIKMNNYDPVAKLYDKLSYLFFGDAQKRAQTAFLSYIKPDSRILIAGGGTGWILEEISKLHARGLDITYVEISQKMIALSRQRNIAQNVVHFINEPIEQFSDSETFDAVITAFLFDNFSEATARNVFSKIHLWIKPEGYWLFADFDAEEASHHLWQKAMLSAMYLFFRQVCNVEAKYLISLKPWFKDRGYVLCNYTETYGRFIFSALYQKQLPGNE